MYVVDMIEPVSHVVEPPTARGTRRPLGMLGPTSADVGRRTRKAGAPAFVATPWQRSLIHMRPMRPRKPAIWTIRTLL
jgi:hypothetical protein